MDVLINGMVLGCVYAFVALGFTITYSTTLTLNFAQGELVMLGAMTGISMMAAGLALPLALVLSIALMALLSALIYWVAIKPFNHGAAPMGWILSTFGIALALRTAAGMYWGKAAIPMPPMFGDDLLTLGPLTVEPQQIVIVAGLLVVVAILHFFMHRSLWGKALAAVAQNRLAAALSAIPPGAVATIAFAISGALAALAGLLIAPVTFGSVNMGGALLIKAFTICVLAGLNSIAGTVFAGLLFGVAESLVARYLGSEYRDVFGLALLIVALSVKPTGMFSRRRVVKV